MPSHYTKIETSAADTERELCAALAVNAAHERFRMPCGGLSDDWREGFEAACEFIAGAIRDRSRNQ
jgi:hypothetical protein